MMAMVQRLDTRGFFQPQLLATLEPCHFPIVSTKAKRRHWSQPGMGLQSPRLGTLLCSLLDCLRQLGNEAHDDQMTVRYAHFAPQHQLAAVQRLCDTGAVPEEPSDAKSDTTPKQADRLKVAVSQEIPLASVA
jgi:hypothetical protein